MKLCPALSLLLLSAAMVVQLPAFAQQQYNYRGQSGTSYSAQTPTGVYNPQGPGVYNPQASYNAGVRQVPYYNQPGYGYYTPNPYASGYPAYNGYGNVTYGAPVAGTGGYFQFGNAVRGSYWKSPSGYYYPWGGVTYGAQAPVIVVQQGESRPAQPPISDMFKDIRAYLDEQNGKGKFLAEDYAHLSRRLRDVMQKESMLASRGGGVLDSLDEDSVRKDLSMLSGDIARRVKP